MDRFMLLKTRTFYPDTLEMESLIKRSSIELDDFSDIVTEGPLKSTLMSSNNSSSSASLRSHSPDFSSSLDLCFSKKSNESIDPEKAEQLRRYALNRSLEEISRELKEFEDCFTVAEDILRKEKERDKQLYDRERQRRTEPETTPSSVQNEDYKTSNDESIIITSPIKFRRKSAPPRIKSPPTYKIYSATNSNRIKSPTFCNSRLYFKNGRIGCADAEQASTNVNTTHEIVKRIIKKENEYPLVPIENVQKVLSSNLFNHANLLSSPTKVPSCIKENEVLLKTISQSPPLKEVQLSLTNDKIIIMETKFDGKKKVENVVGTPIEEDKISVMEFGSVLNDQYQMMSDEKENVDNIPIPGSIQDSSPEKLLDPDRHQFVRERLHHLVNRFSDRTRRMRHKLEVPPTPSISSISGISTESPAPPSINTRIAQNEKLPIGHNNLSHTVDCGYWICPIFCGRGHDEVDGLDPQGRFYISWLFIVSLAYMYNAWVIPLRSSFPFQTPENNTIWLTADYCADFVYLIDVIFIKHRLIYLYNGFLQTKRKDTRINYMKKLQFKMDVLSLLPLDLLYIEYGFKAVFRIPRLIKIQSFWEFFKLLDRVIASPFMVRVAKTLTYMLYMIHLTACAYYFYSDFQGLGTNRWVFSGKGHPYVRCFAFATKTATSIGKNPKPENDGELIFMTAAWLMGVFVFALLIGQIRDIIATATRQQSEYKQLVDETLEYMRRLKIPAEIQRRVKMWFTFTWEQQRTLDESHILDTLPANLKTDIAISVHMQTLSKVQLFAECDEALLRELVLKLQSVTFIPGDYVCKKGEVGKEMYIIKVGEVQVMGGPNNNEVLATLLEGSYFGEISLLAINGAERNRRTADVKSKGFSNLFVLSKSDLNEALVYYPDAQQILRRRARSLMRKNAAREANRTAVKVEEEPDVVIKNPKRPPSPPLKFIGTVMQSLPTESFAVKLLTQGSRRIKTNKLDETESNKPTLEPNLLLRIQNELNNNITTLNLTDSEKNLCLRESSSDPSFERSKNCSDINKNSLKEEEEDTDDEDEIKCNVIVHREM